MTVFAVSGPDVDTARYGRVASAGYGLSVATSYASRASSAGVAATYYVRDEADELVGRAESDGTGSVEVWGERAIRAFRAKQVPVPSFGGRAEGDRQRRRSPSGRPAPTVPTTKEDSMAEQTKPAKKKATTKNPKKPAAKKSAAKKATETTAVAEPQAGENLVGVLMQAVRETVAGEVEETPNKSGTSTRLMVGGKTFAYIFPPRKAGLAVKIPKQLLAVEPDLPAGHGFHRTTWGLSRTITSPDEASSVASAFAVAAATAKGGGEG